MQSFGPDRRNESPKPSAPTSSMPATPGTEDHADLTHARYPGERGESPYVKANRLLWDEEYKSTI